MIRIFDDRIEFLDEKGETKIAVKTEDIPNLISSLAQIHFARTDNMMLQILDETKTLMFTLLDNRKYEKEKEDIEDKIKLLLDDTSSTLM